MNYVIGFLVVIASVSYAEIYSGNVMPAGNKWWMNYTVDTTAGKFQATVWCKTKGWLAMGLSNDGPSGHAKTDSMIAFLSNGTKSIHDQYSAQKGQPILDVTQGGKEDFNLVDMGTDADSMWVSFWRNLNTNDGDRDITIANKNVYVAWACGTDVPVRARDGTIKYNPHPSGWFGAVQTNFWSTTNAPGSSSSSGATGAPIAKSSAATALLSWPLLALLALALPAFF